MYHELPPSSLDPQQLVLAEQYDLIRKAKKGLGLVEIRGGRCTGCNVVLPVNVQQKAVLLVLHGVVVTAVWDQAEVKSTSGSALRDFQYASPVGMQCGRLRVISHGPSSHVDTNDHVRVC